MIEIEALNPYLCKTSSYFDNQTEKHQEIIHELEWYRCNWCKDAVNRQNSLAGHLRNHHEDHVEIKQSNIEALSNTYAKVSTSKLVCKRKDENEKITCQLKTEVNIERINQGSKEFVKGNDEIPETLLNQVSKEFVKGNDEIPETLLKSVPTKFIGQGGKIRKLHQGCNRF